MLTHSLTQINLQNRLFFEWEASSSIHPSDGIRNGSEHPHGLCQQAVSTSEAPGWLAVAWPRGIRSRMSVVRDPQWPFRSGGSAGPEHRHSAYRCLFLAQGSRWARHSSLCGARVLSTQIRANRSPQFLHSVTPFFDFARWSTGRRHVAVTQAKDPRGTRPCVECSAALPSCHHCPH